MDRTPYEIQIQLLKKLKAQGADKSKLRSEARKLEKLKVFRQRRTKKSLRVERDLNSNLNLYQAHFKRVPVDEEGFVFSFEPSSNDLSNLDYATTVRSFFRDYGFVVFRGVLNGEECARTQGEIWDFLETSTPGFKRDNSDTYQHLSSQTYGLASVPAIFSPQIVLNRCHPNVLRSFRLLIQDDDILISHDRWCAYRPTRGVSLDGVHSDRPDWKTKENLHLDLNPWTYFQDTLPLEDLEYKNLRDFSKEINNVTHASGPNVQGVLALNDNRIDDGGTVLLAGFQNCFAQWTNSLGSMSSQIHNQGKHAGNLVWRGKGAGSYKFSNADPIHKLKQRITMRAGSLLIWDQRVVHGSNHNNSCNFRLAQFIKAFRRASVSETRMQHRSDRLRAELELSDLEHTITSSARKVLGLSENH